MSALAQNAAEIQAVQFAYDDIRNLSAIRSNAASTSQGQIIQRSPQGL